MFKKVSILICILVLLFNCSFSWSNDAIYNYIDDKAFIHVQINLEKIKNELKKYEVKIPEVLKPWIEKTNNLNKLHLLGSETKNVIFSMLYILEGKIISQEIVSFFSKILSVKINSFDFKKDFNKSIAGKEGMKSCIVHIPGTEHHLFGMFNTLQNSIESIKSGKKIEPIFPNFEKNLRNSSLFLVINNSKHIEKLLKIIPNVNEKIIGNFFGNIDKLAFALKNNKIGLILVMESLKSVEITENNIKKYQQLIKRHAKKQIKELNDEKLKNNLMMQKLKFQTTLVYLLMENMKFKKKNKKLSIMMAPKKQLIPWIINSIAKLPSPSKTSQGNMSQYFEKKRNEARLKACKSNMMTIEASTELFYLENPDYKEEITMELFLKKGIMKNIPHCPAGGHYKTRKDKRGRYCVECDKHGNLYALLMEKRDESFEKLPEKFKNLDSYCLGNMLLFEDAAISFIRDNPDQTPNIESLLKKGYIKFIPHCRKKGKYDLSINNKEISVSCSVHKELDKLWIKLDK